MNKEQMINEIIQKLKLVNVGVINPESIDDNKMDDLRDIHAMVSKRDSFSPSEMSALTEALGQLRK
ncbi:DUF1128 domain-containing protein [Macrococcus animalis]|uniref:DUF1128 domain-containing protein n=1 Tax=Macrococcus animalis TaxID=3395467 RepID=UPI0039BF3F24